MERVAFGAAVGAVFCFVTAAVAQDIEVSSLDIKRSAKTAESMAPSKVSQGYIVDVSGRQVRLVGPRFFPDNSKDVELFGRSEALAREEARSQLASN